jgi:hypothetical protein
MRTHSCPLGSWLLVFGGVVDLLGCGGSPRADGGAPGDAAIGSGGKAGTVAGTTGDPNDTNPGYLNRVELCDGSTCEDRWQDLFFESCNPDYPTYRHTIAFSGGQIVLDMRITGHVGGAVMLAAFISATGRLDGTAFSQTDYWKLVYSGDHHHFTRNFAVLFDTPIGGACGLKVANFWGNREFAPLPDVSTIQCDLSNIATLAVTSATLGHL